MQITNDEDERIGGSRGLAHRGCILVRRRGGFPAEVLPAQGARVPATGRGTQHSVDVCTTRRLQRSPRVFVVDLNGAVHFCEKIASDYPVRLRMDDREKPAEFLDLVLDIVGDQSVRYAERQLIHDEQLLRILITNIDSHVRSTGEPALKRGRRIAEDLAVYGSKPDSRISVEISAANKRGQ